MWTLTQHQKRHSHTVEEAAAATAASRSFGYEEESDGGKYSDPAMSGSLQSPLRQHLSSPSTGSPPSLPSPFQFSEQPSNLSTIPQGSCKTSLLGSFLPCLHCNGTGFIIQSADPVQLQSGPSNTSTNFGSPPAVGQPGPIMMNEHRLSLTSPPATYGPPPTLEPPTHQHSWRSGSASASPHVSDVDWIQPDMSSFGDENSEMDELTR